MGLVVLPIHIWDRELDARILLITLAAKQGHIVLFGHEYGIAPIYKHRQNIFCFGAGRPIYNEPRTNEWYEPIVSKGGFNGLVFEEGFNNIDSNYQSCFNGINERSVNSTSKVYSWTEREKELLIKSTITNLKSKLSQKIEITGNTRLELLGEIGHKYFRQEADAIRLIFGDFILVSDNFGGVEMYTSGESYDPLPELKQRCSDEETNTIVKDINKKLIIARECRDKFTEVINKLIKDNPNIPFIIRPHPLADDRYWNRQIIKQRNVHIIYKNSIQPWINASLCLIHSGCTTGIEAQLSNNESINIAEVCEDKRDHGLSSKVSKRTARDYKDIKKMLNDIVKNATMNTKDENNKDQANIQNSSISLDDNMKTLDRRTLGEMTRYGHNIDMRSALTSVINDINWHFGKDREQLEFSIELCRKIANDETESYFPNKGKARYYSAKELNNKCNMAMQALGIRSNIQIIKLRRENVFLATKLK